jgi:hypothetical protein
LAQKPVVAVVRTNIEGNKIPHINMLVPSSFFKAHIVF